MNYSRFSMLILLSLLGGVSSCERTDLVEKEVVSLYVDLRIASEEYGNTPDARIARQNLMRQAGFTEEQFRIKVQEVRSNPELWMKFQNDVVARLDSLRNPNAQPSVKKASVKAGDKHK